MFTVIAFKFPKFSSDLYIMKQGSLFSIYHKLHQFRPFFAKKYLEAISQGIFLSNYGRMMALIRALSSSIYEISSA
jgi:hypothetical protein